MSKSQGGYVTVTVMALLLGLSIVALSLTGLTRAKTNLANRTAEQTLLDIKLESAFNTVMADLIEQRLAFSSGLMPIDIGDGSTAIEVSLRDEGAKLRLSNAIEQEILEKATALSLTPDETSKVIALWRGLQGTNQTDLTRLQKRYQENWPPNLRACYRDNFTWFVAPRRIAQRSSSPNRLDGAMISVHIRGEHNSGAKRGLMAVALITGRRDDPVWIFDWQRMDLNEMENCRLASE